MGELQATDYPPIGGEIPLTEPRGCPRGASFSWYLYNPMRIKYPYIRGVLLDLWEEAKKNIGDPIKAWASIVEDPAKRLSYVSKRGKGGLRRVSFDKALEIIAASNIYTIKNMDQIELQAFHPFQQCPR